MADKLLTSKKQGWAEKFKPNVIKGTNLNYNMAVRARYQANLLKMVNQMTSQTKRDLEKLFKHDAAKVYFEGSAIVMDAADMSSQARILMNDLQRRFEQLFGRKAKPTAEKMVDESDKASASAVNGSLKKMSGGLNLKTKFNTPDMTTIMKAHISDNVELIRSIPQKYFLEIKGAVYRSITSGNGLADLVPAIQKYDGMTRRRAETIAADQTRKVYSNLNFERMAKVGVKKFEWIHSGGGQHARPIHVALDGEIFSMDNLPVIDEDGTTGIPGQLINCRCTMSPVIEFDEVDHRNE